MALIFGRFDKASDEVREAIIQLSVEKNGQLADYAQPARIIFELASDLAPDATASDLTHIVTVLVQEGQHFGFIGPHIMAISARIRFEWFIYQRGKSGYKPSDGERYMTLSEIRVLMLAQRGPTGPSRLQR